jgi:hypothetical protein
MDTQSDDASREAKADAPPPEIPASTLDFLHRSYALLTMDHELIRGYVRLAQPEVSI